MKKFPSAHIHRSYSDDFYGRLWQKTETGNRTAPHCR
jgi:hypothetical protein